MIMPGNTPLHLALESGHGEAAALLIEAGADRERVSRPSSGSGVKGGLIACTDEQRWSGARRDRRRRWTRAKESTRVPRITSGTAEGFLAPALE